MSKDNKPDTKNRDEIPAEDDLQKYLDLALELGADQTKVIEVADILLEDAVVFKCQVPRCHSYGKSAHCPPHAPLPADIRELLKQYEKAILFARRVPTEVLLKDRTDSQRRAAFQSIYEIVSKLESTAFYDGFHLATGFAAGSCKSYFCWDQETCAVLQGGDCLYPVKARPSMESVGMNVFTMMADAGWDISPIGSDTKAEEVPTATLVGIVIIK